MCLCQMIPGVTFFYEQQNIIVMILALLFIVLVLPRKSQLTSAKVSVSSFGRHICPSFLQ